MGPSPPPPCFKVLDFMLLPPVLLHTISPHARRGRRIRDGLRPLPPTPKRNLGFRLRSTLLGPRLVELSEEPRWVESNASRVENGTRNRFLGMPKTLLAALRRTLVEPWPSQPLGKRRGACGLQRIAHPPADAPVPQVPLRVASPPPPLLL